MLKSDLMPESPTDSGPSALPLGTGDRHSLVLRAWEAANSERDLRGVLAAVFDLVQPAVPVESIGIVAFLGEKHDLHTLYSPGVAPEV